MLTVHNKPISHLGVEKHCGSEMPYWENTTQCTQPGFKPRLLDSDSTALTQYATFHKAQD